MLRDILKGSALRVGDAATGMWNAQTPLGKGALATMPVPILGDVMGLAADAEMYAKNPESRTMGNIGLSALGAMPLMPGMTVWHASPHKFDKFDSSKIGTGEGAQAYGHGLYLAEGKHISGPKGHYTKTFETQAPTTINGEPAKDYLTKLFGEDGLLSAANIERFRGDVGEARKSAQASLGEARERAVRARGADKAKYEKEIQANRTILNHINELDLSGAKVEKPKAYAYEVDIPDSMIDKMLDWDKPLSEQPEGVKKALKEFGISIDTEGRNVLGAADVEALDMVKRGVVSPDITGRQLYRGIQRELNFRPGGNRFDRKLKEAGYDIVNTPEDVGASAALKEAGIPGIKYLDQGSRTAGEGTRNFVVFPGEEKNLKILNRK